MTCPACTIASSNPRTGEYRSNCEDCRARALAQSPQHADARDRRKLTTEYMEALRAVYGDGWEAGHQRVKAWAQRLDSVAAS